MEKWIYSFNKNIDGVKNPAVLLGNKGIGLNLMTGLGLPVPQGFTILTPLNHYFQKLISDLSLHRKAPSYKMIENTLNIITAYRDPGDGSRKQQLEVFKKQIQAIFKNKIKMFKYFHGMTSRNI